MRILLYDERAAERDRLARALTKGCAVPAIAVDARELVTRLGEADLDVCVLGWSGKPALATVRSIQAAHPKASLVALVDCGEEMAALAHAGVQEFLRRPLFVEEVHARLATIAKLRAKDASKVAIESLPFWASLGETLAHHLETSTGWAPSTLRPLTTPPPTPVRAGSIVLSLPEDEIEIRVCLVADSGAETALANVLFQQSNLQREQLDDMLREVANLLGANVKRLLTDQELEATTGLPDNQAFARTPARSRRMWRMSEDFLMALVVEVHTRKNLRLPASKLIEGMVLVRDIRSDAGALLVPAGTCVTATTADRVRGILGAQTLIEVADRS